LTEADPLSHNRFHRRRFAPSALSTSPGIVIDIPSERLIDIAGIRMEHRVIIRTGGRAPTSPKGRFLQIDLISETIVSVDSL
jgi:hypothetical protein